jgi:ATP-dependent DNA helicase 2 subunit 2
MAEAITFMANPQVKEVRPIPFYRGVLTIGSPDLFPDDAISIDVERYPRTKRLAATSASKYVPPPSQGTQVQGAPLDGIQGGSVALQRTYKIKKGEEDVEVSKEDLEKGYSYGWNVVHISDADVGSLNFETTSDFGILDFVEEAGVSPWFQMGVC